MEEHFKLTDSEFELKFENASLNPEVFTHEAHLRLAYIHIQKYGQEQAVKNICSQLLKFVTQLGAAAKFNKTVTVSAVKAVKHFMQKAESQNFEDFILEFPRLKYNFKELLAFHYKIDIFNSETAKKEFLEPDLEPFE